MNVSDYFSLQPNGTSSSGVHTSLVIKKYVSVIIIILHTNSVW